MAVHLAIDSSDMASVLRNMENGVYPGSASAIVNAAGVTWTAAQVLSASILRSGAAAVSDTTPTAAALVALFTGVAAGAVRVLRVRNNNTGTLTIVAGTGVTLEGTTTIATVSMREYLVRFTNVTAGAEAVTLSGMFTALV